MKKQLLLCLVCLMISATVHAQTKPDLPVYTEAQKMERRAGLGMSGQALGIAYAKSLGKTPKEYGQACAKLARPKATGRGIDQVVQTMYDICQGHNCPFELVSWSPQESIIKRGLLLQEPELAERFGRYGVTPLEFEAWDEGIQGEYARLEGYSITRRQEGTNIIITLKKM